MLKVAKKPRHLPDAEVRNILPKPTVGTPPLAGSRPQLVISGILLAVWLVFLAWMAFYG